MFSLRGMLAEEPADGHKPGAESGPAASHMRGAARGPRRRSAGPKPGRWRWRAWTVGFLGWMVVGEVQAALYFSNSFRYNPGPLGTTGSSDGWSGSNSGVVVTEGSLEGAAFGLPGSEGNKVTLSPASSAGTYHPFHTGILTGSVYYSGLLRIDSAQGLEATGKILTGLLRAGSASSYYVDLWLRGEGSTARLGVSKLRGSVTWHPAPVPLGATVFFVLKYRFVAGSNNDEVALWLNPRAGTEEPAPDVAFSSGGDGNNSTGIGRLYLYGGVSASLDELRIASSWAEAAPGAGTSPPELPAWPRFGRMEWRPEGLWLEGHSGVPDAEFELLATEDLRRPLSGWSVIERGRFGPDGSFRVLGQGPLDWTGPARFYRLRTSTRPAISAPAILWAPTNVSAQAGATVRFQVVATGTEPLHYAWFFNTNTPVGSDQPWLVLTNVQESHAGTYHVLVSNAAGVAVSPAATLTVSRPETPPVILSQPRPVTAAAGQTVVFHVLATGSSPLMYQWYRGENEPLAGATHATLTLTNITTNDAGPYWVVVTNLYGAVMSEKAWLSVLPEEFAEVDFAHVGFADSGRPITGGAAGPTVYVGTEAQLRAYADVNPPYTIYVTNSFALSGMSTHIRSHKTVIGLGDVVLTGGGLYLYRATNVIIRNLTIRRSTEDGIGLHYSAHVWIDHCTIEDCADGAIDITQQSDFITISWCRFRYSAAPAGNHNFVSLIGSSDADSGSYRVTYHHNWWDVNCVERMPSVRFGRVHIFNNYYEAPGNQYCIRTRKQAELLVEHNFFRNVRNPWERYITSMSDVQGRLRAVGNNVKFLETGDGVTWTGNITNRDGTVRQMIAGDDVVFTPPYMYRLRPVDQVPWVVTNYAGAGRGPFAR